MCNHDPLYQQEHESAGGVGCPICNAERRAASIQIADAVIPAGKCQICGLDLTEHPHSESECMAWFAEDYRDAAETRADLWQF